MYEKWLKQNTRSLAGKTVAITGSTGGLGTELCRFLASLGATLVLIDRNHERSAAHRERLLTEFPYCRVTLISADLADMTSVRRATRELQALPVDIFIHNAGAYSIPRHRCDTGLDNVFQINFASPYYMIRELLPRLREVHGHVMVVGSIAHNYAHTDKADVDFSKRRRASLVYGNAKRYLMFALSELCSRERDVTFSITHPGITFTGITAHYPRVIFALIKHPMKLIFMRPHKAALCLLSGVFTPCAPQEWIGPRVWNVWGLPKKRVLRTCDAQERAEIAATAERIYKTRLKGEPSK